MYICIVIKNNKTKRITHLKRAGLKEQADEMTKRIFASGSYDEALQIMMEYCEVE